MTATLSFPSNRRFQARSVLGHGRMGTVFRALDLERGGDVALKALREVGATARYNLREEFRSLRDIAHPNLVALYELVEGGEDCFFTMELVEGVGFLDYVRGAAPRGTSSPDVIARLANGVTQLQYGITTLHATGKLHRDVKPGNVMVAKGGRVVLLDFGLATTWSASPAVVRLEQLAGTLPYVAPEQVWGKPLFPSADWYSVGVLLYQALTGHLPFPDEPAEMLSAKERLDIRPPRDLIPSVPEPLDDLVMALLDPNPSSRAGGDAIPLAFTRATSATVSRAAALPVGDSGPFTGRSTELDALQKALDDLLPGRPSLLRIVGSSGIGKSRLVSHFLASSCGTSHDARVEPLILTSRCHPLASSPFNAFAGIVEPLSQLLSTMPRTKAPAIEPNLYPALSPLFPVLGRVDGKSSPRPALDDVEPSEVRRRAATALRQLFAALSSHRPLVVWIDDLQWADADSGVLLRELLQPTSVGRLLFLVSYDAEEAQQPCPPACLALRAIPAPVSRELVCGPLPREDARLLAWRLLGGDAAPSAHLNDQVDAILTSSGGSPFALGELARAFKPSEVADGGGMLSEVTRSRIDHLPDVERRIVEIIAVAGGPLDRAVALRAAGVGERGRSDVSRLCRRRLVRTTELAGGPAVETYHDRLRESILKALDADARANCHRDIALALPAGGDPEALFRHWLGAGERGRAATHAAAAAARAAAMLAFVRAAGLYGEAIALRTDDGPGTRALRVKQADALANAGRTAEAAPLYLHASRHATATEGAQLAQRAAESYLVSGQIDRGVAVLPRALAGVAISYPRTSTIALVRTLVPIARLWLRDISVDPRPARALPERDRMRIDLCVSAARGLLNVDFARGAYFAARGLTAALRLGEGGRIAEALALVGGAVLSPLGRAPAAWGHRLLARAQELASPLNLPRLRGLVSVMVGQARGLAGDWGSALTACQEGLETGCRGATWETNVGHMNVARALDELGRFSDYATACDRWLQQAVASGDGFGRVTAQLNRARVQLMSDEPVAARAEASAATAVWTHSGFDLPHLHSLRIDAMIDVYEGHPQQSWQRLRRTWPSLAASGMLRFPHVRIDANGMRARLALAGAGASADRDTLLRDCARHRRLLVGEKRTDTTGHALFLEAGEGGQARPAAETLALLDRAIACYESVGMRMWASYARHRMGEVVGGDAGRGLCLAAQSMMREECVVDPTRWLSVVAPGLWPSAG